MHILGAHATCCMQCNLWYRSTIGLYLHAEFPDVFFRRRKAFKRIDTIDVIPRSWTRDKILRTRWRLRSFARLRSLKQVKRRSITWIACVVRDTTRTRRQTKNVHIWWAEDWSSDWNNSILNSTSDRRFLPSYSQPFASACDGAFPRIYLWFIYSTINW